MKQLRSSIVRSVVPCIALAIASTVASAQVHPARPQLHFEYEVTELPDLPVLFHQVHAFDVNDAGEAVGYYLDSGLRWRAIHWDALGHPTDLGGTSGTWSMARGISSSGIVGGFHGPTLQTARPCLWIRGVLQYLPEPPVGFGVEVYDVNDAQESVGRGFAVADSYALLWNRSGAFPLHTSNSYAFAINEAGTSTGFVTIDGYPAAARWDGTVLTVLPDLGYSLAKGIGINSAGKIVGGAGSPVDGLTHAVAWSNGNIIDLGAYPGGLPATATGINDHDVAVGYYYIDPLSETKRAAVWSAAGVVRDLNDLDDPTSGWTLDLASNVNDNGWIVGEGTRAGFSGTRAYVAKPH